MADRAQKGTVRIELTEEQKGQIHGVLSKEVPAPKLSPEHLAEELEERIAPGSKPGIAGGDN